MPRTPDTRLAATFTPITHSSAPPSLDPTLHPLPTPLNVLILGAARGIGAGIARAYARAGAGTLILAARSSSASAAQAVARDAAALGPSTRVVVESVDVTCASSVAALAARVGALCKLDVVVYNAGISGPVVLRVGEGEPGDFADVVGVNVQGTYLAAHFFVPVLLAADGGARAFVVVGSLASCITTGDIANTAYCVSKFAQARLVEFVAAQYRAQGVVAHAVHPGAVLTDLADETTPESFRPYLTDDVDLCGAFCVWLTRERRAWLSGRLVSAKWDVDELLAQREEVEESDLLKFGLRMRDAAGGAVSG